MKPEEPLYRFDSEPDFPNELEDIVAQPRDSFVDQAKTELKRLFAQESESVFYQRQLQVMFEGKFFH